MQTPLGDPAGSFLVNERELKFLNVMQRQYFEGRANEQSMQKLFQIPLSPQAVYAFLFDDVLDPTWECYEKTPPYTRCKNKRSHVELVWKSRQGSDRLIYILHSKASVKLKLKSFSPKLDLKSSPLEIKVPASFKKIKI